MLIKQIERAVVASWAPGGTQLIGGSAAQQLDASFNTSAALEVFDLGLAQPTGELQQVASIPSENRFHKLVWGPHDKTSNAGIVVGGCDDGILQIYNADKLLESNESALVAKTDKHSGPVRALDFNPYQTNLLATGASQSEIFIWDLNNTSTPMTPGTKSQPPENVQWISWNRQVQHILSSTFASRCVVWDLRKNEPIIKLTDSNGRVSWRIVSWHPDVATQLCLASEDDLAPIIQLWDLRFATAPLKVLENHTRGVLSMAWCQQDPDLLISCGKDNRILCWNPNSNVPGGEVLSELARTSQWSFEVSWCPKNPALISASTSDGLLSVYSLMGGPSKAQIQVSQQQTSQMLADSFPGMGDYIQNPPQSQHTQEQVNSDLAKPPKWLKKPIGAKFGFGGKLVSFLNEKSAPPQPGDVGQIGLRMAYVSQVVTEPNFVERSNELENVIQTGNYLDYCRLKADATTSQHRRYVWYFLKTYFEPNSRSEILNMLGYKQEDVYSKLSQHVSKTKTTEVDNLTNQMASLNRGVSSESEDPVLSSDTSADLSPGLDGSGVFDAIAANTSQLEEEKQQPFEINTSDDSEGLITQALLTGNIELAVDLCFENDRMADGLALATTGGPGLIVQAQQRYLKETANTRLAPIVKALITEDWLAVIENCKPNCWREALVGLLTYASEHQLSYLVQKLGERLQQSENSHEDAILCYICAGSIQNLVNLWWKDNHNIDELQELVEVVAILQKAIELQGRQVEVSGKFAKLLTQYALLLAAEGNLAPALAYLSSASSDNTLNNLRNRLHCALGLKQAYNAITAPRIQQGQSHNLASQRKNSYYAPQQPSINPPPAFQQPPPAFNTNPYNANTGINSPAPNQSQTPAWMQQNKPAQPQMNPQMPSAIPNAYTSQPPQNYSPGPPSLNAAVPPPPRPSSVSSTQGSSGLPKSKYVLDPSVQPSVPSYNSYGGGSVGMTNFNTNPISSVPLSNPMMQSQPMPPLTTQPTSMNFATCQPGPNNPIIHPSALSSYNNQAVSSPAYNPLIPPNPLNQQTSNPLLPPMIPTNPQSTTNILNPVNVSQSNNNPLPYPSNPLPPGPNFGNNQNIYNPPSSNQMQMNANTVTAPPPVAPPTAYQQSAPGWNDPPVLSKSNKQHSKNESAPPNPITHPLYASAAPDQNNGYMNQQPSYGAPYGNTGQTTNGYNQVPNIGSTAPPQFNTTGSFPMQQMPLAQTPPVVEAAKEVAPPKQKGPIPEEHIHLKTVLDELQVQCYQSANNPQYKRKLDDVKRKLECLYDLLRDNLLSPNTLTLLHQMIQMIQQGDYNGGLNVHTQLVSGPDFSQIATFMPGLKVLLQSAHQLGVYLR
ncbi:protein transport protein Sec31A isoform X3 [Chrysoperla carnea]|uniref:protein transport protein Sec31A isoform X3 n=1 Tax=Chrysoperla carnea TaxID=189513 RepID=UPI001D082577|nr:protein transport protein Sec31A isoform X3 [Chrysoperla carnea]